MNEPGPIDGIAPGRQLIRAGGDRGASLAGRLVAQLQRLAWRSPLHSLHLRGRYPLKLLAVPIDKVLPLYQHWQKPEDMNELRLKQIQHFFEHYKDLEPGKWVKTEGWGDAAEAERIVQAGFDKLQAEGDGHGHGGEPDEDA